MLPNRTFQNFLLKIALELQYTRSRFRFSTIFLLETAQQDNSPGIAAQDQSSAKPLLKKLIYSSLVPTVQFLIAFSMQKRRGKAWPIYHVNEISVSTKVDRQRGEGPPSKDCISCTCFEPGAIHFSLCDL